MTPDTTAAVRAPLARIREELLASPDARDVARAGFLTQALARDDSAVERFAASPEVWGGAGSLVELRLDDPEATRRIGQALVELGVILDRSGVVANRRAAAAREGFLRLHVEARLAWEATQPPHRTRPPLAPAADRSAGCLGSFLGCVLGAALTTTLFQAGERFDVPSSAALVRGAIWAAIVYAALLVARSRTRSPNSRSIIGMLLVTAIPTALALFGLLCALAALSAFTYRTD